MRLTRFALAALAPLLLAMQDAPSDRVDMSGYRDFRIGMSESEILAAHPEMRVEPSLDGGSCHYLSGAADLPGLGLMIIAGELVRIDVFEGGIATREGARIGMTGAELIALYPARTHVESHPYGDAGDKVIHHASPDGAGAMAFEVVDGRITAYRAGQHGPVQFIEGCL
ncbi:MAG: hypothetical protein H7X93_12235 [Sphingomonadaceae bacterium]|nr:hypothetical protein [Sphingomonadaceae bacterium]